MSNVLCTRIMYTVQCTLLSLQCQLYNIQFTMCLVQCMVNLKFIPLTIKRETMNADAKRGYLAVLGILGSVFMVTGFTSVAVAFCSYWGLGGSSWPSNPRVSHSNALLDCSLFQNSRNKRAETKFYKCHSFMVVI